MGSFGQRLEQERTRRGISLQDIADATKISSRMLRALETEEFDKLPGGIFNRGFVRAYARQVGLDPESAVADFAAAEAGKHNGFAPAVASSEARPARDPSRFGPLLRLLIIVLMIAAAIWAGIHYRASLRNLWQRLTTHRQSVPAPMTKPSSPEAARH